MIKKNLYMVRDNIDDPGHWHLMWDNGHYDKESYDEWRLAEENDVTLENVVDLLDQHAESINAHDFVTTHRALAALMVKEIGREAATKVFLRLVSFEGLHGLTGVCGRTDVEEHEKELGVRLNCWPTEKYQFKE